MGCGATFKSGFDSGRYSLFTRFLGAAKNRNMSRKESETERHNPDVSLVIEMEPFESPSTLLINNSVYCEYFRESVHSVSCTCIAVASPLKFTFGHNDDLNNNVALNYDAKLGGSAKVMLYKLTLACTTR